MRSLEQVGPKPPSIERLRDHRRRPSFLAKWPVTPEVAGSSPVALGEESVTRREDALQCGQGDDMPGTNQFASNMSRLAGLHGLAQKELATVLGLTPQSVSLWRTGREPSARVVVRASEIFLLPAERIFSSEFAELMPLMCEPDHYRAVEKNIQRALRSLKSV